MNYDETSGKMFMNCCDFDVLLDPELGKVEVEMRFKPECLPEPGSPAVKWRRFYGHDAVNELLRQGIIVDNPNHTGYIDNLHGDTSVKYSFKLPAPKVEKKTAPAKKTSAKKKATAKTD